MKLLHKVVTGALVIGSASGALIYFLSPTGPKITAIKNPREDKRRFNKNPMEDAVRRANYMVCRRKRKAQGEEDGSISKFCREKWFKQ